MGTRADFYIGRGETAEWIGSIAFDGYPDGIPERIMRMRDGDNFREAATAFIKSKHHGSLPADGWPWPWEDSRTTDFAYAFDDGRVWTSSFGKTWHDALAFMDLDEDARERLQEEWRRAGKVAFPNMAAAQNAEIGGPRSGMILAVRR